MSNIGKFTKDYQKQPNPAQRAVMAQCFKSLVEVFLLKGKDVIVEVEDHALSYNGKKGTIMVHIIVNNELYMSRYIGARGGVKIPKFSNN